MAVKLVVHDFSNGVCRLVVIVAGALLVTIGLAACSTSPSQSDGPYAAEFEQARQNAVTDFQEEVLSDDQITDEEFREVRQRYIDCLSDAGIEATANPNGSYDFALVPTESQAEAERQCSRETILQVESLYYVTRINPNNEDFSELIVDCLRTQNIVDESFTGREWDQFTYAYSAAINAAMDKNGEVPLSKDIPNVPTLPSGVSMEDLEVQRCVDNPLGE